MALLPRHSLLILLLALAVQAAAVPPPLQLGFYARSCPRAEAIVRRVVHRRAALDRSVLPALIRLYFHDCFVRGCDGSVLIDSTPGHPAEKDAPPNLTLRMLDVIDDVKSALEKACPGVVSCADIVALAARDAAAMAGRVRYQLPTGRRDGTVSSAAEVNLPSPSVSFAEALSAFRSIGLGVVDLTTLLGSHTMGFCHCGLIVNRLYSYNSTSQFDPTMDAGLRAVLRHRCPPHVVTTPQNESRDVIVPMNFVAPLGPFGLDNSFYPSVLAGRAVLQIDQELTSSGAARRIAAMFASRPGNFRRQFARSMVKLGGVNVLTGRQGEVLVASSAHGYGGGDGKLRVGFYKDSCPDAEATVRRIVAKAVHEDPTANAPLLRLHFHDCFVRGCEGSVLINSTKGNTAEKDAKPNHTLDAFDVIDDIKEALEKRCPGTVSCADILAIAARDAVSLATKVVTDGKWSKDGNLYEVETGRRDGRASSAKEAVKNLPDSFDGIRKLIKRFASKNLSLKDLAVLSGAHAIGKSHCPSIAKRLRNFTEHQDRDPTLDREYADRLRLRCRRPKDNTTELEMVPGSSTTFGTAYYGLVVKRRGLFHSDEALLRNDETERLVRLYRDSPEETFLRDFGVSMVNMGRVAVLTGNQGDIRKRCAFVN
ncbi:Peroxidase 56 [Dichanthelium oligosanthes]|uniref:Peroxidase 1 n=1 Tax=Dichanthelium oligosanthes TaxID=888268 RepID=A0A1E5UP29_9POAL|nr:Peroxidase 56 [Dichanthelium oligosanthes]